MQKADHGFFIDRTVLYKAFLIIKGKQEMEETEQFKALTKEEIACCIAHATSKMI